MNIKSSEKAIEVTSGTIFRFFLITISLVALYYLRDIVLVVLLAIVIASAIEPGTKWFLRRGVPRIISVLFIYSTISVGLILAFYFLFLPILIQSADLLSSLPGYLGELKLWNPIENNQLFTGNPTIEGLSESFSLTQIVEYIDGAINNLSNGFFSTASSIFGGVLSFVLVIVLSFYLSTESDGVTNFLRIVTPIKQEKYIIDLWKRSQHKIGLWMQGQIILSVIVAVLVFLGLTLLGVENALVLAVLAGMFEIIPLFGPILAAIPAVTIALLSGSLSSALVVVGLYVIIQQFENQLIYPLVVRKIVGVPPIVSILALIIGGKLAGFIGLIISVPLASMFMEYINDLEKDKIAQNGSLQKPVSK